MSATTPPRLPPTALFINRELSWLEFDARVLHEAEDPRVPLLERVKFLAIFSTNLDEFYMVRVAGIRRKVAMGAKQYPPDGLSPLEQLTAIRAKVRTLLAARERCLTDELLPALAEHGVELVRMAELTPPEWMRVDEFFESQAFPVLTPLALDPGHRFPYISNLSLSLAIELRDPDTGAERFARLKVPKSLPRWVPTGDPARPFRFVPLEEVIGGQPHRALSGDGGLAVVRVSDHALQRSQPRADRPSRRSARHSRAAGRAAALRRSGPRGRYRRGCRRRYAR